MNVISETIRRIEVRTVRRRNRYDWFRQHLRWTQRQWQSVMFTYESRFCLDVNNGPLKCGDDAMQIVVIGAAGV